MKKYIVFMLVFCLATIYITLSILIDRDSLGGALIGPALITLVPLGFIFFSKKQFGWFFFICTFLALMSGKRMAALGIGLSLIFFYKELWNSFSKKELIIILILLFAVVIPYLIPYIDRMITRNEIEASKVYAAYGSGRLELFSIAWNGFIDSNIWQFLFGHGALEVTRLIKGQYGMALSSHNGFLNMSYDYGLIGIILYLAIFYELIKLYWWYRKRKYFKYSKTLLCSITIWFFFNLVSHGYIGTDYLSQSILWAYLLAEKRKITIRKNNLNVVSNK